jgi:hypothetical protein
MMAMPFVGPGGAVPAIWAGTQQLKQQLEQVGNGHISTAGIVAIVASVVTCLTLLGIVIWRSK